MRYKAMACAVLLLLTLAADQAESTTFLNSSAVNMQSYTAGLRPLKNFMSFGGAYYNPDLGTDVSLPDLGTIYSNSAQYQSDGFSGSSVNNWTSMMADPGHFFLNMSDSAQVGGALEPSHSNMASFATMNTWYILNGPEGTAHLRMDVAVRGMLAGSYQPGGRAAAYFTHFMTFVARPDATLRERPLVINGAAIPPEEVCGGFSLNGTVPDQCFLADGTEYPVDYVIRTNPFGVTVNVPFSLTFSGNITVAADDPGGGEASASADFYDVSPATAARFPSIPALTPEGFVVDLDGDPATADVASLASLGYTMKPFAVPTLASVAPARGGDTGYVSITLSGSGFMPGAVVKLVLAGAADILAESVDIQPYREAAVAVFNLEGQPTGVRDVVLLNEPSYPAASTVTLPAAFTIETGVAPQIWMDIQGRSGVRPWEGRYYFNILVGNTGGIDAIGTPVINGIPAGALWQVYGLPAGVEPVMARPSDQGIALLLPTVHIAPGATETLTLMVMTGMEPDSFTLDLAWE